MNKNNLLLLMLSFGMMICLVGCKRQAAEEVVIFEDKRVSGPLSDPDINWSKEDYQ
jgi:hypothetical protein